MKWKVTLAGLALIGGWSFAQFQTNVFLPWVDLAPYRLDGLGFTGEAASEAILRIRSYLPLKNELARFQTLSTGLEMALSNQSEQTKAALSLAEQYQNDARREKKLGNEKGLNGLLIGSGAGIIVGSILGILVYSALKK